MNLLPFEDYSRQLLLCLNTSTVWAFYEPTEKCYGCVRPLLPACKLHCFSSCSRKLNEFKTRAKLKLFPCHFKCFHLGHWCVQDVSVILKDRQLSEHVLVRLYKLVSWFNALRLGQLLITFQFPCGVRQITCDRRSQPLNFFLLSLVLCSLHLLQIFILRYHVFWSTAFL